MKLYHYTNIESLALILQNKTIRFNRLDKVDDIEEGNTESLGVKFCKYVFASCWTENSEESVPLWKMYGGDSGGVRITIEQKMFKEYIIQDINLQDYKCTGSITSIIPQIGLTSPSYFIIPICSYENEHFYRQIKYVEDVSYYTKDAIKIDNIHSDIKVMSIDIKQFGYYKHKRWDFQNESRFVLYILPINVLLNSNNPKASKLIIHAILNNHPLGFTYYDMTLKDDVLNNIEITLSPSITEAQRIIIQALVDKYVPNAQIKESVLGQLVRLK